MSAGGDRARARAEALVRTTCSITEAELRAAYMRNLLLRGSGIEGIYRDVLILILFSGLMIAGSIALFKRQI